MVQAINSLQEFHDVINSGSVCVIDFWATWCGPCRFISPVFEKLSEGAEMGSVKFYKVDVDAQEDIAREVGIKAMPTFVAFKDGNRVDELVGADQEGLQTLLRAAARAV